MKAFPNEFESAGMDLRDYFAAHAPLEPQSWFKPNTKGLEVDFTFESITKLKNSNLSEEEKQERLQKQYEIRSLHNELLLKQWPYAWADAMMEARKK